MTHTHTHTHSHFLQALAIQWRPIPPSTGIIRLPLFFHSAMGWASLKIELLSSPLTSVLFKIQGLPEILPFSCIWVFSDFTVQCTRHPFRKDLADQAHRHTGVCLTAFLALKALTATQFVISSLCLFISPAYQLVQERRYHFFSFKKSQALTLYFEEMKGHAYAYIYLIRFF